MISAVLMQFPAFGLEVRVTDSENGKPLAGAKVISQGVTNITDGAGRAMGQGPEVIVTKSGYAPMKGTTSEFKLLPAEKLSGRVIDTSGKPVSGAAITVIVPGPLTGARFAVEDFPVTSDAEGKWMCDFVPKGSAYVRLEFSHPDFDWPEQSISLPTAELKVYRLGTVSGRVLDDSGQTLSGALVVLGSEHTIQDEPATRTGQDGKFAFPRQRPQKRLIGIDADGWAPTMEMIGTNFAPIEVRLNRGKPWRFQVEDDSRRPLAAVKASVAELKGTNRGVWYYWDRTWETDASGSFVWTNGPHEPCAWNFSKAGLMTQRYRTFNPSNEAIRIRLGPTFSITGTVVDATTGKPIPEFVASSRFASTQRFSTAGPWQERQRKAFSGGNFNLSYEEPLLAGSAQMHDWQFRVEADGYEPAVSRVVRDAERGTNLIFELKPQPAPQITLPAPSGKQRVTAALALQPTNAAPGETVMVFIKARIAEGHWIYALDESGSENMPTRIEAKLPRLIGQDGPWRGPEPKLKADGTRTIAGEALFASRLMVQSYARAGKDKLQFKLEFQVCNELLCWPPESIDMEAELEIVKPR